MGNPYMWVFSVLQCEGVAAPARVAAEYPPKAVLCLLEDPCTFASKF